MCGTCNGDAAGAVPPAANSTTDNAAPSASTSNGVYPAQGKPASSPYQAVQDYISNVGRFKIIESTLREGEQFANAFFDIDTKIKIAKALDNFGVDYIELTSPVASQGSYDDCKAICQLGLKAKILTHVRCNMEDARKAVECGVDGVDLVIGTSSFLREYSHGKSMDMIKSTALEVIAYVKSKGIEVRFSSEDSFRSNLVDILHLYQACDKAGVDRVGVADTVGGATPRMVYDLIRTLRGCVGCDIETHFHDDTGCAVANAHSALEAGATHVDTSVLGIGERNGITPLSGALMARMVVTAPDYVKSKYNLKSLKSLETLVADAVQVNIPFNNPVTGFCAGIHAKAILANPSTYEIIDPHDFGMTRYVSINSRITGWNAVKARIEQLGLGSEFSDDQIKEVYGPPLFSAVFHCTGDIDTMRRTAKIKQMADIRPLAIDDTDSIIRSYHLHLQT
ncbi:homocitrate synthase [Metarhizium album ARSEF 1941]|uniref:homocitrate synthase n=1 Tax=Metarhizium album (strain ARSEF 1941) TaxID=1081103 RepID=A0A0B2WTU5_METAS|nr:homocitrate synthase [Metarhizium album ARSEF 1941]KHN96340.1 homocitrate synthase [Metarhizium album ARSEF 1941]